MASIKKTHEQLTDFNIEATAYLKKSGVLDSMAREIKGCAKTKLDIALLEILFKQINGKIATQKRKRIQRLEIKHAMVDPNTKKLIVDKGNPAMGIPETYEYTSEGKIALLDEIDALEKEEVDVHQRSIPKADMPELTEEEKEAFGDLIVITE